jgi:hypothetical protein
LLFKSRVLYNAHNKVPVPQLREGQGQTPDSHFHIHWLNTDRLDWQCFETQSEANASAAPELALPSEIFKIVELSTGLSPTPEKIPPRCGKIK